MRLSYITKRILPLLALPLLAASCAYLIPENPNTPRYNTVMGERRPPIENLASMRAGSAASVQSAPVAQVSEAPIDAAPVATAPVTSPDMQAALPPVDAQTQAIANQRMQVAQNDDRSIIDRVNPWSTPKNPNEKRMVPLENAPVNNGNYPTLSEVPPSPDIAGSESSAERLAKVRAQLERDKLHSEVITTKTLNDAKADPSLLAPMPAANPAAVPMAPAPAPINMDAPQSRIPSANPPQAVNVPPMGEVRGTIATLPPPPAPVMVRAATPEITATPLPPATVASAATREPILLRQPASNLPPEQPAYSMNAPAPAPVSMAPAASGSFDPMADSAPIVLTPPSAKFSTQAYLPPSRYSYRR